MNKVYDPILKKEVFELFMGDYFTTRQKNIMLSTVLGPCIAVCLADKEAGIVGMNHFVLPGRSGGVDSRYGFDCTDLLLRDMICTGASLKRLTAKVFGGANVFKMGDGKISDSNISFVKGFLDQRGIPVVASDIGNTYGRRIYFCSSSYQVGLHKFEQKDPWKTYTPECSTFG